MASWFRPSMKRPSLPGSDRLLGGGIHGGESRIRDRGRGQRFDRRHGRPGHGAGGAGRRRLPGVRSVTRATSESRRRPPNSSSFSTPTCSWSPAGPGFSSGARSAARESGVDRRRFGRLAARRGGGRAGLVPARGHGDRRAELRGHRAHDRPRRSLSGARRLRSEPAHGRGLRSLRPKPRGRRRRVDERRPGRPAPRRALHLRRILPPRVVARGRDDPGRSAAPTRELPGPPPGWLRWPPWSSRRGRGWPLPRRGGRDRPSASRSSGYSARGGPQSRAALPSPSDRALGPLARPRRRLPDGKRLRTRPSPGPSSVAPTRPRRARLDQRSIGKPDDTLPFSSVTNR